MKLKMNGKVWNFVRVIIRMKDAEGNAVLGDCDPPNKPNKQIRVDSRLKDQEELEIIIHELLHAGYWIVDEEHIAQTAHDLARILWRLGYRKDDS